MKVKRLSLAFVLLVLVTFMLFSSGCTDDVPESEAEKIKVSLKQSEGVEVKSEQILEIVPGQDVEFDIEISDDYIYLGNSANATYDKWRKKIKLTNVLYPTAIELIVVPRSEMLHLSIEKNVLYGEVKIIAGEEWMSEPGIVTLYAEGFGGYFFSGWSIDALVKDGGSIISTNPYYSFELKSNTTVYANFSAITDYTIVYHANGGTVKATGKTKYTHVGKLNDMFTCQQTLESNGTFVREGYVAVGYSTEPVKYEDYESANDIPGFSNMGGVCEVGESGMLDLYVVWAKATPASEFVFSDGEIKGYKGRADIIVIPEKINGVEVKKIGANAFSAIMKKVVIPRTVTEISNNAFYYCNYLKEIVFFDSVTNVSDESFSRCAQISTIVLNSQRLPKYSGSAAGSFCIKYERMRTIKTKKIIVVSGSSTLNGLDSPQFEKNFPGYSVVNYGTNAAHPSLFYLEVISKYVNEGDIVVHAPEFLFSAPMGDNTIVPKLFRGNEQCYDIFREVDMRNYKGFFTAYYKFLNGDPNDKSLTPALNLAGKPYQNPNTGMNKYGDLANSRPGPKTTGNFKSTFSYNILNGTNLNKVNKMITEKGAYLVMSFATFDKDYMNPSSTTQAEYDRFTEYCQSKLDYPVISNVGTYIMEHKYFFDNQWHCSHEGASVRTENLTKDIKAFLNTLK